MLKNCSRLTDNALCDWLFSLHEDLKAYTSVGDRPVLSDLLQAGSMTASLLEHGIGRTEAVSHATDDVYVSRRRNAASKRVREITGIREIDSLQHISCSVRHQAIK